MLFKEEDEWKKWAKEKVPELWKQMAKVTKSILKQSNQKVINSFHASEMVRSKQQEIKKLQN